MQLRILAFESQRYWLSGKRTESGLPFQARALSNPSPCSSKGSSGGAKPRSGWPWSFWIVMRPGPAAGIETFNTNSLSANVSGMVTSSPPTSGACNETNLFPQAVTSQYAASRLRCSFAGGQRGFRRGILDYELVSVSPEL
jgi:hypothetical protein